MTVASKVDWMAAKKVGMKAVGLVDYLVGLLDASMVAK